MNFYDRILASAHSFKLYAEAGPESSDPIHFCHRIHRRVAGKLCILVPSPVAWKLGFDRFSHPYPEQGKVPATPFFKTRRRHIF